MEDSHVVLDMPSCSDHTFLAVFDGHGGAAAAIFAAANLIGTIEETIEWQQYLKLGASDISLLGSALTQAFLNLDAILRDVQSHDARDLSGCTCISAMFTPWHRNPTTGIINLSTSAATILPNAPPITTPTAKSITFPRIAKALNSCSKLIPFTPGIEY